MVLGRKKLKWHNYEQTEYSHGDDVCVGIPRITWVTETSTIEFYIYIIEGNKIPSGENEMDRIEIYQ